MSRDNTDPNHEPGRREELTRRGALVTMGALGAAGVSVPTVGADPGKGKGNGNQGGNKGASGDIEVVRNPKFITNAQGERLPQGEEPVFDPAPASIPLNRIVDADEVYDATLFESLNDSRQLVVKPPENYDREAGYEESWPALHWSDIEDTGGTTTVGGVKPDTPGNGDHKTGTRVNISVENAIPNGQYTIWVVKFAALNDPGKFDGTPKERFVTPAGNGLVGFHNLGQKFDSPGSSENAFTTDSNGDGTINTFNEGGPLSGVPGFRPIEKYQENIGEDPDEALEESPVPFVGEASDYEQEPAELAVIANDLREEDQISFIGAYHYDDQTWGVYPGPWHLNQFGVSFVF
jgi:hypothetical protein